MSEVDCVRKDKILVVDDDPHIVEFLKVRLEVNDYEVVTAYDGLQALKKVKSESPDLIILDILMPRMDGSMFLQKMKQEKMIHRCPVIVLTAKANMKEFFLVQENVVEFLVKPFEAKNLLSEIAKHLSSSREPGKTHLRNAV